MLTTFLALLSFVLAALGYRWFRQTANARALVIRSERGISESTFVEIGGIRQWIQIRGEDIDNPVVLFLHGGPGVSYIPFAEIFRAWEERFTIVHWDQRGAGKTFGHNAKGWLTIDQMVDDGIELAEHLRRRLGKEKIILFCHSWGSILGIRMVAKRPDLFSTYFGAGQVANMADGEKESYRMLTARLQDKGDSKSLKMLEAAGPPPYQDMKKWMIKQRMIVMTSPPPSTGKLPDIMTAGFFTPGYSLKDSLDWYRSFSSSVEGLYAEMMVRNAEVEVPRVEVPVCIIQGDDDFQAPLGPVRKYFDLLDAPQKELVVLAGEGHTAVLTIPETFLAEMIKRIEKESMTN